MRLPTEQEVYVLELMTDKQEHYAWNLVKMSEGVLSQNSIYVVLMRMVARGLLKDRLETREELKKEGPRRGARRRQYKVTGEGIYRLQAYRAAEKVLKDAGLDV